LDQFVDPTAIAEDIIKWSIVTVGFTAFVVLVPLTATSTHAMMRRQGRRRQQLQRLICPVARLGVIP
jgi:sulfoxide reductase heme-binding subunit YedZ